LPRALLGEWEQPALRPQMLANLHLEAPRSPKRVGFPDPLSGTLKHTQGTTLDARRGPSLAAPNNRGPAMRPASCFRGLAPAPNRRTLSCG
jgi:hypothetical protein